MYSAKIKIKLRKSILDPQGKAVENSISSLGYDKVKDTRIGKYIELELDVTTENEARQITEEVCRKLLANPVMEDFDFDIVNLNGDGKS